MIEFEKDRYDDEEGHMVLWCDAQGCTNDFESDGDWHGCMDAAKAEGWQVRKAPNGEWLHFCPDEDYNSITDTLAHES